MPSFCLVKASTLSTWPSLVLEIPVHGHSTLTKLDYFRYIGSQSQET